MESIEPEVMEDAGKPEYPGNARASRGPVFEKVFLSAGPDRRQAFEALSAPSTANCE